MEGSSLIFLVFLGLVSSSLPSDTGTTKSPIVQAEAEPRATDTEQSSEEPPEGYYAFVESPNATPPRVRPPPYRHVSTDCAEVSETRPHVSANNLCGDLNKGIIPRNPMGQNPNGEPYPFSVIRNSTLRFLSRTLPVLRADDTLPRVSHLAPPLGDDTLTQVNHNRLEERSKRAAEYEMPSEALPVEHRTAVHEQTDSDIESTPRESRRFCDGGGVFCMLYRAINGDSSTGAGVERREDPGVGPVGVGSPSHPRYEGPPTPCPARVDYATPVFARNYQGVWRYVVQIPYEGYFTQTVEVIRCMQSRCHYLDGGCLSSPRWVSLLVAELHYPPQPQLRPAQHPQGYQQYVQNRAGQASSDEENSTDKPLHCDGHDEMGCFQVRLYYDWFLVPGSCKCWRPDYFERYVRRRHTSAAGPEDL